MWDFIYREMKKYKSSVLFDEKGIYSYNKIIDIVKKKGDILKKLPSGSKCGILCEHKINEAIAILACWRANLIPVIMSYDYGKRKWEKILQVTEPMIVIKDKMQKNIFKYEFNIETNVFAGKNEIKDYGENLDGIALILCTSGTTGMPKGVMLSKIGIKKNVVSILKYFHITSQDNLLISRPLCHCAVITGEFLCGLYVGCNIGFLDGKYQPLKVLGFCYQNKISSLCGTPTLFNHLSSLIQRDKKQYKIRKIVLSGECLSKTTAANIRKGFKNCDIYHVYGLTEASPRVSYLLPEKFDDFPESVGVPLDSIEIKIIDEKGNELAAYEEGEILIKTPSIMKGYYRNEDETAKVIINGWLRTNDLGYKDNNDYLYILSRKDDMIIKGGMNIYPKEIESELKKLIQIEDCLVYGIQEKNGQEIGIDIVLNDDFTNLGKKEVLKIICENLPEYQIPTHINIVNELQLNVSGKIVRKRLEINV